MANIEPEKSEYFCRNCGANLIKNSSGISLACDCAYRLNKKMTDLIARRGDEENENISGQREDDEIEKRFYDPNDSPFPPLAEGQKYWRLVGLFGGAVDYYPDPNIADESEKRPSILERQLRT